MMFRRSSPSMVRSLVLTKVQRMQTDQEREARVLREREETKQRELRNAKAVRIRT